ncbi:MAG: hypothetical protein ABSD75_32895, partial [Terriglobales bacterium]
NHHGADIAQNCSEYQPFEGSLWVHPLSLFLAARPPGCCCSQQRAAGHRISTAHVESVMNHLVNHRLGKKQQMRWSRAGAHYLLQVRAELLNGTLIDRFRVDHPRFRGVSEFISASS